MTWLESYNERKPGHPRYLKDKTCLCGKVFRPTVSTRKFCSYKCAILNRVKRGTNKACEICSTVFYVRPGATHRFCSMKCMGIGKRKKNNRRCRACKKIYHKAISQEYWRGKSHYCSNECKKVYLQTIRKPSIHFIDNLWSKLVKLRAKNRCEFCGKKTGLNSHHIFSRSNRSTRWDIENGVCVCIAHHVFGNFSAHKAPIEFVEWLKNKRGNEWYQILRKRAGQVYKPDYIKIRATLQGLEKQY